MDRGQWVNLARTLGLHPYSFLNYILGFLRTIESLAYSLAFSKTLFSEFVFIFKFFII